MQKCLTYLITLQILMSVFVFFYPPIPRQIPRNLFVRLWILDQSRDVNKLTVVNRSLGSNERTCRSSNMMY